MSDTEARKPRKTFLIFMLGVLLVQAIAIWAINQDHPGVYFHKGACHD